MNGVVLPLTTIYLDAVEGGRVEEKYVDDGTMMKKGEPILRLSNTDLELSLVNQQTNVYNLLDPNADFTKCCPTKYHYQAQPDD